MNARIDETLTATATASTAADGAPAPAALGDRYELLEEIGRGGMGRVYKARDRELDRSVAVKILNPGIGNTRFQREAKSLAAFSSQHVVRIYDIQRPPDDSLVLVMEWIDGIDLGKRLRGAGGPLPPKQWTALMRETCAGMFDAEEHGIVHRDLKPSNLLIDRRNKVYISDFGLARSRFDGDEVTREGQILGSPHYMSPEQAADPRSVDVRSDIYSFGATFYHVVTGRPPFQGDSLIDILVKHRIEPLLPPAAINEQVDPHISELLERCLAKSSSERFQSFAEIDRLLAAGKTEASAWLLFDDEELQSRFDGYLQSRTSFLLAQQMPKLTLDELQLFSMDFPSGQRIEIVKGNMVRQRVDAIVSSDDCYLTMGGGVSNAIADAAGADLRREVERLKPLRPGRVAVTSGGKLPQRFVFHAVTVGFGAEGLISPSRDLISELVAGCLYHAETFQIDSIALPLLGTGAQGFAPDVCLDTIFLHLARVFMNASTTVRLAKIVIY